ncbi:MAG: hypothetical protein WD077_13930 [Bacteroidia bacterium]
MLRIMSLIFTLLLLFSCNNGNNDASTSANIEALDEFQEKFLQEYAGSYWIMVKGDSEKTELFDLKPDGSASWTWTPDNQVKSGTWKADSNIIATSIQGNSGLIEEDFKKVDGSFQSTTSSKRYLRLKDEAE